MGILTMSKNQAHPALANGRGLYAITDGPRQDLYAAVEAALAGGARLLQYRDKTVDIGRRLQEADELARMCARYDIPLIVNDDVELAAAVGAGVHLGEDDGDIAAARRRLGEAAIIGVSCYDSIERARAMADAGADYLAFGAFFPSPTKPDTARAQPTLLRQAVALGLPLVAIGGITPDNGRSLIDAGADYLAVVSAVFGSDDVQSAALRFSDLFVSTQGSST
jgi:thiamine-phosphate pyrophosphorylase